MSEGIRSEDRELRDLEAGFCVATQLKSMPNLAGVKSLEDSTLPVVEGFLFIEDEKSMQYDDLKQVA